MVLAGLLNIAICINKINEQNLFKMIDIKRCCILDLVVISEFDLRKISTLLFCVVLILLFGVKLHTFSDNWVIRYRNRTRLWLMHCAKALEAGLIWTLMLWIGIVIFGWHHGMPLFNWNITESWYGRIMGSTVDVFVPAVILEFFAIWLMRILIPAAFVLASVWIFDSPLPGLIPVAAYGVALEKNIPGFLRVSDDLDFNMSNFKLACLVAMICLVFTVLGGLLSRRKEFYEHKGIRFSSEALLSIGRGFWVDLRMAVTRTWWLWLPTAAIGAGLCAELKNDVMYTLPGLGSDITAGEYLMYIFSGMGFYYPESGAPFTIPVKWMIIFIFHIFCIGFFMKKFEQKWCIQTTLRMGRLGQFIKDSCFIIIHSFLYVVILLLTACIFAGKTPSLDTHLELLQYYFGISGKPSGDAVIFFAIIAPVLVLTVMGLLLRVLTDFIGLLAGFVVVVIVYISSMYFNTPALVGSWAMILRSDMAVGGSISRSVIGGLGAIYIVILIVIGSARSRRKNIL